MYLILDIISAPVDPTVQLVRSNSDSQTRKDSEGEHMYLDIQESPSSPKDCDRDYVNIGPQDNQNNSKPPPSPFDTTDLPDYVNISISEAASPPPIPPRGKLQDLEHI